MINNDADTHNAKTMDEIKDLYGVESIDHEPLIAKSDIQSAVNRLKTIRLAVDELCTIEQELKDKIALYMKNKATLISADGELLATWKYTKPTESFNTKLFKSDNKELYAMYIDIKPGTRKFLIK